MAIHVSNVWQTCKWYHRVFGFTIEIIPGGATANLEVAGKTLAFTAHQNEEYSLGLRRRNSFLTDPPAFNLDISISDVQALFNHALACGTADPPLYSGSAPPWLAERSRRLASRVRA